MSASSLGPEGTCRRTADRVPRGIVAALLVAYTGYVVLFALMPFRLSIGTADSIAALFNTKFQGLSGLFRVTPWDVWTNILFFIPLGVLVVLLPSISERAWHSQIFFASVAAVLLSSCVEVAQVFFSRAPSMADIVYNTLGGAVGGLMGIGARAIACTYGKGWARDLRTRTAQAFILTGHLLLLFIVIGLPLPLARDFRNWDPTFRLLLGNEGSLDRPWQGVMKLVAIYDRALTPGEVWRNFSAGPLAESREKRTDNGLLVYYDFSEKAGAIVHDRAGSGFPVDLRIGDPSRVEWITPNGLMLSAGTVVSSSEPPQKLVQERFSPRNELSVEAWVAPADLAQTGPARIVSYSLDADTRNFTLGQQNREVVFRLRTPVSGPNGTTPALETDDSPLDLDTQHLVATYRDGIETLYVNGATHGTALLQGHESLSDRIVHSVGEPFKWPLYSAMIFPLGFLSGLYYGARFIGRVRLMSFGTAFIGVLLILALRMVAFETPFDPIFVMVGVSTLLASVLLLPPSLDSL